MLMTLLLIILSKKGTRAGIRRGTIGAGSTTWGTSTEATRSANTPPLPAKRTTRIYTFVADGEPFYAETLAYVKNLQEAGVDAKVDVYPGNVHAFDMLQPRKEESKAARKRLCEEFERFMFPL